MRGVEGKSGWFWLFLIDGLLTFVIGLVVCDSSSPVIREPLLTAKQSLFYLPSSPTNTKSALFPRPWYSEREEIIMINVRTFSQHGRHILTPIAPPPRRPFQRPNAHQRTRHPPRHLRSMERPLDVGSLLHRPSSLHPSKSRAILPLAHSDSSRLRHLRRKHALDSVRRVTDHSDACCFQE